MSDVIDKTVRFGMEDREMTLAEMEVAKPRSAAKRKRKIAVYAVKATFEDIQYAIEMTNGNMTEAAKLLNTTRPILQRKVDNSPNLQRHLKNIVEQKLDYTEDKLYALAQEGNVTAVTFLLRTKGKERGYTERNTTELELGENARSSASLIEAMRKGAKEPKMLDVIEGKWEER